jgi:hypothetical protein
MFDSNEVDDGFVGSMRTAMRDGVADLTVPPSLLPALRKQYARRVTTRRIGVAAVPLAVAAVVGGVATAPNSGSSRPSQATGTASQVQASQATGTAPQVQASQATGTAAQVQDIAYVTAQANKALDNADHDVVYSKQTYTARGQSQVLEFWVSADGSAVRKREAIDGKVVIDSEMAKTSSIDVQYSDQTWTRGHGIGNAVVHQGFPSPKEIKQALDSGALKVVGTGEVINGQPTIHLQREGQMRGYTGAMFDDLWVNESSYLPIRIGHNADKFTGARQDDFTWLPPTEENLALLTPPIPAGFRQVPENQSQTPPASVSPQASLPLSPPPGK